MSNWTLVGFAIVVLIPLVMIFPKQELLQQAAQQRLGDVLTVSYLTNLMKADPGNLELRLLLAEHKIHLNEFAEIPALIEPALRSEDQAWQAKALLTEYQFLVQQYRFGKADPVQKAELQKKCLAVFYKLVSRSWPIPTTIYLAGEADGLHEHGLGVLLYRLIEDSAASRSTDWFAAMAKHALDEGNYELAAHLYFIARHKAHSRGAQRDYLLAGVRALMSGGLYPQAMQAIDKHVGNLEDDSETLYALVQAARAANDQPRAVRYAKRLLHMSWLGQVISWLQHLDFGLFGISNADAAEDETAQATDKIRSYNKKDYELAYEVFIGNGNLAEAYRVAEAAVRQVPASKTWHKRLAQVAGWMNKPDVALREWRWLLKHVGSREALLAVMKLAPAQNDYDALLDAWMREAETRPLDETQWKNLADLFEQTGRQREGIKFFEARYAADRLPVQLEIEARLAERNGDDELARSLYFRMLKLRENDTALLQKIANLYLRKGEYRKAYDLLQQNRSKVDEKDIAYWKLLADLAWQLQLDKDAAKNYSRLQQSGNLAREDFSRLIYLLGESRQDEKAALAELAYHRFNDKDMLLQALEIRAAQGDMLAQKRLFESVATDRKVNLSDSSRFYLLRAQYLQSQGEFAAARSDFRRAAGLAPDDVNTGNAILWFLIDGHDLAALREMIAQINGRGDSEKPEYWGALAAAYQVLDQPANAVVFYTRQIKRKGQDFLWLVNYADALEQEGQEATALRVRRLAWKQLREKLSSKPLKLPYSQDMLAAARLAMLNYPGDASLALVRSTLRQDRLLEREAVSDRTTSELVLGWAISTEQSSNAKAWLWRRYGQTLNRPLWAEASVAMADNDTERLAGLLDGQGEGMSVPVRHDAANAVGQAGLAQSIAFDGLTDDPFNDEMQQRLNEDVLAASSFADVELRSEHVGSLHRIVRSTRVEMPVARQMRVSVEYWNTHQRSDVAPAFGIVPGVERIAGLVLKNRCPGGDTEIGLRRRNEFTATTEAHVTHAMRVEPRVDMQLGLEMHANASESEDLQVFGMRNQVNVSLLYRPGRREYVQVQPGWSRYYTQTGNYLGSGNQFSWELGHLLRTEYPDLKVRLMGIHAGFNPVANATLALPGNANIVGLCVGSGMATRSAYTQAWRPYADYCATHNAASGQGYNAALGVAGSLAGQDSLSLDWSQGSGGANIANVMAREIKLNYRIYY